MTRTNTQEVARITGVTGQDGAYRSDLHFQRSDRKLGCLYVLTPQGVRQRLQLTQSFLVRKEREYEMLKHQIVSLREELAAQRNEST